MKILYLHNVPVTSDQANLIQVFSMCNAMKRLGLDVTLSLPSGYSDKINQKTGNQPDYIKYRDLKFKNFRFDKYINSRSVKNHIKKYNPDICYVRSPLLFKKVIKQNQKVILELHHKDLHSRSWLNRYWKSRLLKFVHFENVIKVVCISQALTDYWIAEGIPKHKIITAHDAIDPLIFEKIVSTKEAKNQLDLPINKNIITYAGRLYKNRKIDHVLILAKEYPDSIFLIVGGPETQTNYYKDKSKNMGLKNVRFTGQIPHDQIPLHLFASDILLAIWSSEVPTIKYCSPLKIFEYMAAKRTIVVHGFPTIKEVLNDGIDCLMVEPDSVDDLIKKTGIAIETFRESKFGEKARENVINNYTWDKRVNKIFDLIEV